MLTTLLLLTTTFLAYWNGANDNFKGVATLYGSRTVSYRTAITIATIATFAGSICAIFLAEGLIASFSGKGLVPQSTAGGIDFLMAVGIGAAFTVLLATRLGFPISTTHSLVGGLLGAGLMAVGGDVNFGRLGSTYFIPLLVSPFIALTLGGAAYYTFKQIRQKLNINKETCVCIGERKEYVPVTSLMNQYTYTLSPDNQNSNLSPANIDILMADKNNCMERYADKVWGISLQKLLDISHGISAVTVSFARGLNDTPKIAGLLVAVQVLNINWAMVAIATGMAIGGLLNARRVAETISHKITNMSHGQGFSANIVTGILVIFASKLGVPVSTTHVSVGSIFGISMVTGKHDSRIIASILLSWLITLPVATALSAFTYWIIV